MKKLSMWIIALALVGVSEGHANPIPTEDLAQYFTSQGIEYFTVPAYSGNGGNGDYLFVPTRDPQDGETMGLFFELYTGNSVTGGMHWAVGMRGPRSGSPLDNYGGRGLALGLFGVFDYCFGTGGFIEDFTAAKTNGELQLTYCEEKPLSNYRTYRVDLHVSKLNVYTVVWEKFYVHGYGWYYQKVLEHSCVSDAGPGRTGYCPENPLDANHGGFFIGSAFLPPGYSWNARNIHVAFF